MTVEDIEKLQIFIIYGLMKKTSALKPHKATLYLVTKVSYHKVLSKNFYS